MFRTTDTSEVFPLMTAIHSLFAALIQAGYLVPGHESPKNQIIRIADDAAAILGQFGDVLPTDEEITVLAALIAGGHLPSHILRDGWEARAAELVELARFAARRATVPST